MANELITLPATEPGEEGISAEALGIAETYVPEGWESADKFLDFVLKVYDADALHDSNNRDWALEDLEFAAGDQWDKNVKAAREAMLRPCLTINVLPQFIGQVVGDRRLNKTQIKVRPFKDGTAEVADIRAGIIKSIELYSRAERVYDAACEAQVTCGISNFRIDMEYAANDVFDQDIFIRHIPNPLSVIWDRMSVDPTGRDARHCFVTDTIPKEVYEKNYPNLPEPSPIRTEYAMNKGWMDNNVVRITEFWELIEKPAIFAMMLDGDVKDVTGLDPAEYEQMLWRHPITNKPKMRKGFRTFARMHLVSGTAILSEAYELPLDRLPIIRVEGRVIQVGEDRIRFGLVRYAKDSQRLKNYWRSVAAESLALAPKAQWFGPEDAFEGFEDEFRNNAKSGDILLRYKKNASAPPQRVDPPRVEAALLQEAQMNQQDIKDTTGLHDASLGIQSNEVSGKAIQARQKEGDVATVIYHDNLNHSILEAGSVINQLIPIAYDTVRTMRIVGEDEKHKLMTVNDPTDENSPDITKGKYDVVLDTGPSFTTQRAEALDAMMTLIQTSPDLMMVFGDEAIKAMDWPEAYAMAARLKNFIKQTNPGVFAGEEEEGEEGQQGGGEGAQDPAQLMALQQAAQQMEMQQAAQQLELRKAEAETAQAEANARKAAADADAAEAKARQAAIEAEAAPFTQAQTYDNNQRQSDQKYDQSERQFKQKTNHAERAASAREKQVNRGTGSRPGGDRPTKGAQKGK